MKTTAIITMLALMGISGCASQVPVAENFALSYQKKIKAAYHWDVVADDVVAQTLSALNKKDFLQGRPLYIQAAPESTDFNKGFRNFLITRMVNRDLNVSDAPNGAVQVRYETQVVQHKSERTAYQPGTLTALAAGVLVARNIVRGSVAAQVAGVLGLDVLQGHASGGPTKTELIVTTSITADSRFVMRKSDVYYLENADVDLFKENLKNWKVVGQ